MKTLFKHIVSKTYKPLLEKYLSKTRKYRYKNIILEIPPEVFHPGFFFSTKLLLQQVSALSLTGKRFLELGAGSGLISIYAAQQQATVTATDINPVAVDLLLKNSRQNKVELTILQSDLFTDIPRQRFDIIVINPPYYKKQPQTIKDYAWYCGENGEYFQLLFYQLANYIHEATEIYMTLFDGCDIEMVENYASQNQFEMYCIQQHKNILEENFVFKIEKTG